MSDTDSENPDGSSSEDRDPNLEMPEGIAPPPMPKPDLHDIVKEGPTYGEKGSGKKSKKRGKKGKQKSSHPLDNIAASNTMKNSKSGKGCCGCLFGIILIFVLLLVGLSFAIAVYGPGRVLKDGNYTVVNHAEENSIVITEAPTEATYYIGREIVYEAPKTEVPVAFAGTNIYLSGDFYEDVMATGVEVVGTSSARFAKDLEVWASKFTDEGVVLKGELKGVVPKTK